MAISTLNITSGPYLGTGSTTVYPYDFPITGTSEIVVVETTDTGVESVLVLGTHFSVSGVGQEAGGNVTRLAGPLPLNYTWYMRSNYVADQETDFQSQGAFFPDIHESAFDKLTILHQQVVDRIERTIKLSDTQDIGAVDLTLPNITNRALKYLSFDAAGNIVMDIQPTADAIAAAISAEAAQAAAEAAQAAAEAAATTAAVDAIAASAALIAADVAAADGSATAAANSASAASSSAASATSSANASAANAVSTAADAVQTNLDKISASSSATSAGSSAATATTKANEASTSATNSATSASNSATSASAALTSANNSATSASASAGSDTASSNSAAAAAASYDSFDDRYLGPKSTAPTLDNDGNALLTGAIYWSTPESAMKVYTGSLWKLVTTVVEGVYDVTEYTNIATQTTITTTYDVGLVQVLYNGVQLNLGDFTATNGTSIVLAVAVASATDVITVIRWGAVTTSTFLGTAATKNTGVTTGTIPFAEDVVLVDASGNVNIAGTVTADGLTVDGLLDFGSGTNTGQLGAESGGVSVTAAGKWRVRTNGGTTRQTIESNGDISFYEDTGTTPKFFWDASAERLGLGTSSPSSALHAKGGSISTPADSSAFLANATARLVVNHGNEYGAYVGYLSSTNDAIGIQSARSSGQTGPLSLNPYGGNIGIGTSSPSQAKLEVLAESDYSSHTGHGISIVSNANDVYTGMYMGTDDTIDAAYIQSAGINFSFTSKDLLLNPNGGNVGIGTNSASDKLTLSNGQMRMSDNYGIRWGDASAGIYGSGADENLRLVTSGSERARLDSAGSLLVGKTASSSATTGHELLGYGRSIHTANATTVQIVNRLGSDGDISIFQKSGTTIAAIGSYNGVPYIGYAGGAGGGIMFNGLSIEPTSLGATRTNGTNDIGSTSYRWKDLHLSGTANMTQLRAVGVSGVAQEQFMGAINGVSNGYQINSTTGNAITYKWHTGANSNAMTLDNSGNLLVGTTTTANMGTVNRGLLLRTDGGGGAYMQIADLGTGGKTLMYFQNGNGVVGTVVTSGSSTSYNTSSDYRLKEDDVPMTGSTERVKALRPINFAWKADGSRVDGFFAHELAEIVPEAATGAKDAMMDEEYEVTPAVLDAEGNETEAAVMGTRSVPDYQGIDQSKLVPLLTATIQELIARIETLEAK